MEAVVRIGLVIGIFSLFTVFISGVSTFLTGFFMWNIGGDDTALKLILTSIGVILDAVKHLLPIIIVYNFSRKSYMFSILLVAFYTGLAVFSFISSASAIENRVTVTLEAVNESSANIEKIDILKGEILRKEILFKARREANQITKMGETESEISEINQKIMVLTSETQGAEEGILSSNGDLIVYMTSFLIEALGLVLILCVMSLDTKEPEELAGMKDIIEECKLEALAEIKKEKIKI